MHTTTKSKTWLPVALAGSLAIGSATIGLFAQQNRISVGSLSTGPEVSLARASGGEWGLEIAGGESPRIAESRPVRIEIYKSEGNVVEAGAGYKTVERAGRVVIGRAEVTADAGVAFDVEDRWTVAGSVMTLHRKVDVRGNAAGGFYSGVFLSTGSDVTWSDADYLAPGMLYADPTNGGERSPGGPLAYASRRLSFREDYLSAPLFALSFRNGASIAVLDPAPRGNTTTAETQAGRGGGAAMIDERFQFGALGAREAANGGVEFGFWLPGTVSEPGGGGRGGGGGGGGRGAAAGAAPPAVGQTMPSAARPVPEPVYRRRYHPIRQGFTQTYDVSFRFGRGEKFTDVTRETFRWAWDTLKPAVFYHDIPLVQKTLIDFLTDRSMTVEGRTGWPYLLDSRTGDFQARADAKRAALGFCAKNIEAADQLLREADRDPSPRGQRMRKIALDTIATFIRLIPMSPPAGDGFDLFTGQIATAVWSVDQQFLRTIAEDLTVLLHAYEREKRLGRDHPEWLRWAKEYTDWLMPQQRADGSFPRAWKPGTSQVINPSGSASYSAPPLLVAMSRISADKKYLDAAIRAGEYVWAAYGSRGIYDGGASDASSTDLVTDKEAGMLSLGAFLALHDATRDARWLTRAKSAADYTESWIWIWNVPMPEDANNDEIHWKKGVPTIGLQGITARGAGGTDEYLDWSAPHYAQLYKETKDPHYLDVARILLHNTKAMLALPGRTYGMLGPGWQQEHWQMASNRGYGQPGKWLPWLATNHLNSIMSLEDYDKDLYNTLIAKPSETKK